MADSQIDDEIDQDLYADLYDQEGNLLDSGDGPSEHDLNRPLTEEDDEGEVERGMGVVPDDNEPALPPAVPQHQQHQQHQQPQQIQSYQSSNPIPTFSSESGGYGGGAGMPRQGGGGGGGGGVGIGQGQEERMRPSDMPEEGKMFIGGLNWDTTDDTLRNYFAQFGPVSNCTIMRDPQGRSRGFAFLTFENPASVNAVMVREHTVDNKIIDPKRAIPRAEHAKSQKIFVGGLAPSVNNSSLRDFFVQFGTVMDAHVMMDRETMRNKGFGFVTFDDESGVERSMAATGMELDGKMIEVKKAQPRGGRDAPPTGQQFPIATHSGPTPAQLNKYNTNAQPQFPAMGMGGMGMGGMGMPMGGMAGGFDPQAMAMMYQKMMMNMMNPMGGGMGMGMMGSNRNMQDMGGMGNMGNMGNMMPMGGAAYNPMMMGGNAGRSPAGAVNSNNPSTAAVPMASGTLPPNAPRGPAAMRQPPSGPSNAGQGGAGGAPTGPAGGQGLPARYSTQGQARSRPY